MIIVWNMCNLQFDVWNIHSCEV